jgi:hypothetical protein
VAEGKWVTQHLLYGQLGDGSLEAWRRCRGARLGAARLMVVGAGARDAAAWQHGNFTTRERGVPCGAMQARAVRRCNTLIFRKI